MKSVLCSVSDLHEGGHKPFTPWTTDIEGADHPRTSPLRVVYLSIDGNSKAFLLLILLNYSQQYKMLKKGRQLPGKDGKGNPISLLAPP